MKTKSVIVLVSIVCLVFFAGCAGKDNSKIQKKLMTMSDIQLIDHYEMLEMRMNDIDRTTENSVAQDRDINTAQFPEGRRDHLGHLHIGDTWYELNKEKEMTLNEMDRRGISYPKKMND